MIPSIPIRFVKLPVQLWFGAMTVYPFVFLCSDTPKIRAHERTHYKQQDAWWRWGFIFGLILWYFFYIFVLPVGWNPFRWKWEWEAYKAGEGYQDDTIRRILVHGMYSLWWMG